MSEDTTCAICSIERGAAQLQRCRICHRAVCSDCAFSGRAGRFCSQVCSDTFFYGTDEEPRDEDDGDDDFDD